MNGFIFGFQRLVWCPKWTPASRSSGTNSGVSAINKSRRPRSTADGEDATTPAEVQPQIRRLSSRRRSWLTNDDDVSGIQRRDGSNSSTRGGARAHVIKSVAGRGRTTGRLPIFSGKLQPQIDQDFFSL